MLAKKRQGEIALLLIKDQINKNPILSPSGKEMDKKIVDTARSINIEIDELVEFWEPLYVEALKRKISLI